MPPNPIDHPITIKLNAKERGALDSMMLDREMSEGGVIRVALAYYQSTIEKIKSGETCRWSGDAKRASEFSGRPVMKEPVVARRICAELLRRQRLANKLMVEHRDTPGLYGHALTNLMAATTAAEVALRVLRGKPL